MIVQFSQRIALTLLGTLFFVCAQASAAAAKPAVVSTKVGPSSALVAKTAVAKPQPPSRPAPSKAEAEKTDLKRNLLSMKALLNKVTLNTGVFDEAVDGVQQPQLREVASSMDLVLKLLQNLELRVATSKASHSQAAGAAKPLTVSTASSPLSANSQQLSSPDSAGSTPSSANKLNQRQRWSVIAAMAQQPPAATPKPLASDETVQASGFAALAPVPSDTDTLPASAF